MDPVFFVSGRRAIRNGTFLTKASVLLALLMLVCLLRPAAAETLDVPEGTECIDDRAFLNCAGITDIILPESLKEIGEAAFYGCGIDTVKIPRSVKYIGKDAFPADTHIVCKMDSYAEEWASENEYDYEVEVKREYYALLIGQTYENTGLVEDLPGCDHDVASVEMMLDRMVSTPYNVTKRTNLRAYEILSSVRIAFENADSDDVCLFYYSGHGVDSYNSDAIGALVGTDNNDVYLSALRAELDKIPGDKIVILDSCYSGRMTLLSKSAGSNATVEERADTINEAVIRAFTGDPKLKSKAAGRGSYYILASAGMDEDSFNAYDNDTGLAFGVFTYGLLKGSGYDMSKNVYLSKLNADSNGDGLIALDEAYTYANAQTVKITGDLQHSMVYPPNSDNVIWGW